MARGWQDDDPPFYVVFEVVGSNAASHSVAENLWGG